MEAADLFLVLTTSLHITSFAAHTFSSGALERPWYVGPLVEQTPGKQRALLRTCIRVQRFGEGNASTND